MLRAGLLLAYCACAATARPTIPPDAWVPARWELTGPKSLALLEKTPINCLLLPWESIVASNPGILVGSIHSRGLVALALIHPGQDTVAETKQALALHFDGAVLEGDFRSDVVSTIQSSLPRNFTFIELGKRNNMKFYPQQPVVGTYEGVWPGIHLLDENGAAEASPTGSAWIYTNSGFLKAVRAFTSQTIWLSVQPPAKTAITATQYQQAIGDAAMTGARWVVTLDMVLTAALQHGEKNAVHTWEQICATLAFYETHREWENYPPLSRLAVIQGRREGALRTGGVLDMIDASHTPAKIVEPEKLQAPSLAGTTVVINLAPDRLTGAQKSLLQQYEKAGGFLFSAPAAWNKLIANSADKVVLDQNDAKSLNSAWKDLEAIVHRRLLGIRLFNVAAILFDLKENAKGGQLVLALTNYTDYDVENITVHLAEKWREARLLEPGKAPQRLEMYGVEDGGTGLDIDRMGSVAFVEVLK